MSKIILDAETAAKIAGQYGQVELCDPAGNLIGYAVPLYEDLSHVKLPGPSRATRCENGIWWPSDSSIGKHLRAVFASMTL